MRENTRHVPPFSLITGNGASTYSLAGEHASLFKLEPEKGRIIFVTADYEELEEVIHWKGYDLKIVTSTRNLNNVRIFISDVDEEPVAFSLSANTVLEDSAVGTWWVLSGIGSKEVDGALP